MSRSVALTQPPDRRFRRPDTDLPRQPRSYKAVANQAAKSGYRGDLRSAAVERVSAIRRTQLPVKPEAEPKLRGNKAKKAAESS